MAYDQHLANRVRRVLASRRDIQEKAMFGGLAFLLRGNMCCGLVESRLMVRVAPESYDILLQEPDVLPMDFTGKPIRGFLYVEPAGVASGPALRKWVGRAIAFAKNLPPKTRPRPVPVPVKPEKRRRNPAGPAVRKRPRP